MIGVYFLLLMSWGYGVSRFFLRAKDNRFYLFFPVGMATTSLLAFQLWLFGFRFALVSLAMQAIGWTLLPLFLSEVWLRFKKRNLPQKKTIFLHWQKLTQAHFSFFDFPWLFLLALSLFTLAIITLWSWSIFPIHWDNISLYDFRAHQITAGWQRTDFLQNALPHPEIQLYDWHHPWFSSISFALAYSFGVRNVSPLYWLLALTVVWHAIGTWRSWRSRVLFIVGFTLIPSVFITFIEGYSVVPQLLFWAHFFLFTQKTPRLNWKSVAYLVLFASSALQSRLAEPYWPLISLWLLWVYRRDLPKVAVIITAMVLGQGEWSYLVSKAQEFYRLNPVTLSPTHGVLTQPLQFSFRSSASLMLIFLRSPATLVSIIISVLALRSAQSKQNGWWVSMLVLLLGCLGILLSGMSVFAFSNPSGWQDIQRALPRASMVPFVLAWILLTDRFQQNEDSTRMR